MTLREETRKEFVNHVRGLAKYWATIDNNYNTQQRLDGLAFSILAYIDGSSGPNFAVIPLDSDGDLNEECWDIAGGLHEIYHER